MNERIREIFKQAGGKTFTRNLASNPVQVVETHELWDNQIKKFAELVVLECERIAKDPQWYSDRPSDGWSHPINHVCNVMKEKFGVKE